MSENYECFYQGELFPRRQITPSGSSASRWANDVNFQAVDELARNLHNSEINLSVMAGSKSGIKVELQNENLWRVFREQETEMIITRAGRRMFPILDFSITGLESNAYYSCMIQIISADNQRYRFDVNNEKWLVTGEASKPEIVNNDYMHPHGSALGKIWMKEGARFDKVKLSNHHKQFSDFIILTSLQKYRAQLVMTKIGVPQCERWIFDFPETAFIAVTCYQNPSITKLKIDYNPFAKAFRQGKRPAKRPESVKPKVASSSQRSKRPRIHLSSPPPVTRLQPPPLGHFPEEAPRRASSPPPPPPPLNLYSCQSLPTRDMLQEEMAMQSGRCIPLVNDPILWEQSHPMTSHRTCLPPISTSFRLDHAPQPPLFFKPDPQSYCPGWHPDFQYQDHFSNHCGNGHFGNGWMTGGGFGGLFDEVQLRHHGYDSRLP